MICFFIANQMSSYYRSETFTGVLESVSRNERYFELKNKDGRLRIISRDINSISKALSVLNKL